jgi:hypothetical protein
VDPRKQARRERALERQIVYDKLSLTDKISRAKARGGSVKEISRLNEKLNKEIRSDK